MNASFGPFLVIGLGLLLGFLFRRSGRFPVETPKILNRYVIDFALPAVVLSQLPAFLRQLFSGQSPIGASVIFLPVIPWLIFFGAIGFFGLLYRMNRIRREEWGLLALAGGLGNTSFVGIPLIEALMGPDKVPLAVLLDQFGTFLALAIGGTLWIAIFREGKRPKAKKVIVDLLRFPPFVALLASFAAAAFPPWGGALQSALDRIAATLVPVAMLSVGSQLKPNLKMLRKEGKGLALGLGFKMGAAPLLIFLLARIFGIAGDPLKIGVVEASMAPMITATVLGIEAGMAPDLGALMLGIGIPLSLLTVPFIHRLLVF